MQLAAFAHLPNSSPTHPHTDPPNQHNAQTKVGLLGADSHKCNQKLDLQAVGPTLGHSLAVLNSLRERGPLHMTLTVESSCYCPASSGGQRAELSVIKQWNARGAWPSALEGSIIGGKPWLELMISPHHTPGLSIGDR